MNEDFPEHITAQWIYMPPISIERDRDGKSRNSCSYYYPSPIHYPTLLSHLERKSEFHMPLTTFSAVAFFQSCPVPVTLFDC